ncbi:MAG: hypothetical protein CMQ29_12910, partial [Gammaproteobacteria bacterium]|nr:hypothetical protein [Gammaproteobacteria bacterium]
GFTEDLVIQLKYLTLIAVDIFLSRRVEQEIIIDPQGVEMPNYDADLATCDSYVAWLDFGNRAVQRGAAGVVVCAVLFWAVVPNLLEVLCDGPRRRFKFLF